LKEFDGTIFEKCTISEGATTMGIIQECKEFALKGNMIDMATGIIIGASISTVVGSLVKDIIMPPIGLALGGVDFSKIKIPLKEAVDKTPEVAINIGAFINNIISFAIVAAVIFMLIKMMNAMKKAEEAAPTPPAEPPASEVYLKEIRDALVNK
jgi:large conductance mechanosensitive channel